MLTSEGIRYSWEQILQRVGLTAQLSRQAIVLQYQEPIESCDPSMLCIRVHHSDVEQWHALLKLEAGSLGWVDAKSLLPPGSIFTDLANIPVLFPAHETFPPGRLIEYNQRQNTLAVNFDLIAATYIMLTRWEETIIPVRDAHDRFPAAASTAYRQGFLSQPVIDQYALILRAWLQVILPGLKVNPSQYQLQVSHDIDHLGNNHRPILNGMKQLKDHLAHWDATILRDDWRHILAGDGVIANTWAALQLVKWAQELNIRPRFYLMAAAKSKFNEGYDPGSPDEQNLIRSILAPGFEIGLHAGYETMLNTDLLANEKERLEKAVGSPVNAIRQHYLRARVPETWQAWEKTGFTHDASLGFADITGFRCGTCHPYNLFDHLNDRVLEVTEEPLIVMDTTLLGKQKTDFQAAETEILKLAAQCRSVGGVLSLLWHNNSLVHNRYHWGRFYYSLVPKLLAS
jgi:hypothetical protein